MKAIPGAVSARPPLAPSPRGPVVSPGVQTEETGAALRIPVSDPEGISSPDRLTPTTQARLEITAPAASTARESRRNGKGQDMPDAFPTSPAVGKAAVPKDFASSQSSTRKDDSGFDDWKKRTDNLAAAVLAAARVWREPGSPPYKPLDYKPAPTNEPLSVPRQDHEHEEGRRGSGQTNITPYARKEQHQGTKDVHGDEFDNPLSDKEEMRDLLSDWDLSHSAAVDLPKTTTAIESTGLAAALPAPSPAATAGGAQLSTASPAHAFPPLPLTPFRGLLPNPSVSPDIEGHARVGIGNENADTGGIHGTSERDSLRSSPAHRPVHQAGARAGVGLVFKESSEGVVVQSVLKQGGAATSTRPPQAGDLLVAVDSQDVRRKTLTQLRPMLMGEEGSEVVLAFEDADENVYTTSAQRRFPRFQFGARDENAGAQKSAGTMQTFGCAALDAHANAGDAHFEVRGRQPDDADSSGVSREGGARSDVGSKDVPLSAHSTEEDADDTPSWTNSWPGSLGASSYDKNPGKELYMVRRDAQARVEDILYRERLLQEELRRVKEHCVLQAKQEADARARLQHQNDVLRRENAHLHREVEHERLLREQEISFNAHLRQQLERQIRTLQDAAVLGGGAAGVDGIIGELDQAGRMADTDVGRRTGRTAQLHLMQDYANTAPPANTRESTNPEGVGPVAGDVEASAFVGEDGLTSEGRRRSLPQRQHVHEALGQAGASDEVGRNAAVSHHSSRAGSARVADVIAEAGSGGSRRRCPDESEARNGVGVYGSVAAGVSEWGGRELGGAGSGNIQREIFGEMPGEKEDEIIFTKEDVDMTSEINGNGWTGDVSVAPSIVSDDHLGASGTGAIKLPMTAGSRDGTTSTRRIDATSTLGMVGEEGAYFDEWSFSLPARQDELRKGKQNDEHLESESLSAPPISHDVGGIGDIRNAGHLDAVGFPGISAPLLSDEEDGSQGEAELGGVVEHDSFSSPPSAPTGAPLARRSGPRAVSGVLSVDVAGAVGDIDKPKSTSPLLYSTASVGEIHGRSVGSDASTPEVRIGGPQNASTDEGGEGLDGSGPGQGSLMMGPEMERQSVGEDLPIDVEDLYGAYY